MLIVASWEQSEESGADLSVDVPCDASEPTFQAAVLPGGGVSPRSISQGFATSKGPLKSSMQDYFVAVSDELSAVAALAHPAWRRASAARLATHGSAPFCLTAVFDGHGQGDHSARSAQEGVLAAVAGNVQLMEALAANMEQPGVSPAALEAVRRAFRGAYQTLDERICGEAAARGLPHDGSTALVSVQLGPKLYTANAGDCRAVLCRAGSALRLSRDHKPELPDERRRIEGAGGRVAQIRGTWRVVLPQEDGLTAKICSVSRGLGDRDFKAAALISPEPDVAAAVLLPRLDAFCLHASDGLWGAVGDQEAVDCVAGVVDKFSRMTSFRAQQPAAAKAAAQELVRLARDRGSMDDVTVIVTLYGWE